MVTPVQLLYRTMVALSRAIASQCGTLPKDVADAAAALLPCFEPATALNLAEQVARPSSGFVSRDNLH